MVDIRDSCDIDYDLEISDLQLADYSRTPLFCWLVPLNDRAPYTARYALLFRERFQ